MRKLIYFALHLAVFLLSLAAFSQLATAQTNTTLFHEPFDDLNAWTADSPWAAATQQAINGTSARCNTCGAVKNLFRSFDLSSSTKIYLNMSTRTQNLDADGDYLRVFVAINGGADQLIQENLQTNVDNITASFRLPSADGVSNFTLKFVCNTDDTNDRCIVDDVYVIDEVVAAVVNTQQVNESISFSDFSSQSYRYTRNILQDLAVAELGQKTSSISRVFSESSTLTDIKSTTRTFLRSTADQLNIFDVVNSTFIEGVGLFTQAVVDFFSLNDLVVRVQFVSRTMNDAISATDLFKISKVFSKFVSENLNLDQITTRLIDMTRPVTEFLSLNDVAVRLQFVSRSVRDTISFTDLSKISRFFTRLVSENLQLNQITTRLMTFTRIFNVIIDLLVKLVSLQPLQETPPSEPEEEQPIAAPSSGTGVTPSPVTLVTSLETIVERLNESSEFFVPLQIKNKGGTAAIVNISVTGEITNFTVLNQTSIAIAPNSAANITIIFSTYGSPPGMVYTGEILLVYGNQVKRIPVVLIVISKLDRLLDIRVDFAEEFEQAYPGDKITAQISIFNLGLIKPVDVTIVYNIANDSAVLDSKQETLAIDVYVPINRSLKIPRDTAPGTYRFEVVGFYGNQTASSFVTFRVAEGFPFPILELFVLLFGVLPASTATVLAYRWYKIRKLRKRKTRKMREKLRKIETELEELDKKVHE